MNQETKTCQNCRQNFKITSDDLKFYDKIKVPPPTWCPECRFQRRIGFRNEFNWYQRKCELCGSDIIAVYSPDKPFKVYCASCWFSDKWSPQDYARDFDASKSFLEQWLELLKQVPRRALNQTKNTNSEYTNYSVENKNCYLCASVISSEDCAYGSRILYSRDCFDCLDINKCELCYQCIRCDHCSRSAFCTNSESLVDCWYCFDCKGLSQCFGCVGLRNKNYHWLNSPLTQEEYKKRLEQYFSDKDFKSATDAKYKKLVLSYPHRYANIIKASGSVGDNIANSRECRNCFFVKEIQHSKNLFAAGKLKDSYDVSLDDESELSYEIMSGQNDHRYFFGTACWYSQYLQYCDSCIDSNNLFACIGLRNKQYCILNKQYTKSEYEKLVPRIIEHMNEMPYIDKKGRVYRYGEFFPPELSPFSYNETIAQEYFPLTKEEAVEKGYSWKDPEARNYQITMTNNQIPDHIKDVKDSILNEIIECQHQEKCNEQCTQAFRIIPQELAFLRKMNLPLPRLCPNCRHYQRIKARNPLKLWHRKCQCAGEKSENGIYTNTADHIHHKRDEPCPNEFETTYAQERPEIVYCEACYLREVA